MNYIANDYHEGCHHRFTWLASYFSPSRNTVISA